MLPLHSGSSSGRALFNSNSVAGTRVPNFGVILVWIVRVCKFPSNKMLVVEYSPSKFFPT